VLIGVVLGLALWFACFRSRHEWTHKLRGIPCSAGMVSEYFEWHGLQDDGFGGKGALDVGQQQRKRKAKRRGATGDDGLRLVLSSDGGDDLEDRSRSRSLQQQQQQADEVEPESIPDWARDNTWCPKLRCPPAPFQLSMLADTLLFVFFSLALFLDRWFTTSRLSGSEMESEIIWGNIQLQYGGASGIAGPERRGYDCTQEGVEVLAFMRAGQCAAIKASGILLYVCGLLYFLLAVVKIYTGFYASLRNVALVAYRHRITRGSGQRRKAGCCGCHARLIRSYLQLRYLRFYLGWAVLFPMAVWRLLTIRDAFSLISPTMLHASFILLLFCLLLDIFALVGEARALERILEKQDKEKEEKRRRGAYVEEDEEDGNGERNRDSSSYVRPPPQRRMQQDPDEYVREQQRLYGDADSSGPYSQQEDEHDHWTTSDLERERRQRAKMAAAQPQQGDDDGEEKKGQAPVLPQHAPIYSSYAAPSTMLLSSSSTSPPSTSVPSAAGTEMSILGQRPPSPSLHSASSSQSHHLTAARRRSPNSSTVSSSRQPSQGTRHALENHTSWRPEEELDEPFDL
jgi:hypothetical protein